VAAAQLLFCALRKADQAGALEQETRVLELGVGVGVVARLFLDAFRALCRQHGRDYYDRLCYVAGDYSERRIRYTRRPALSEPAHFCSRAAPRYDRPASTLVVPRTQKSPPNSASPIQAACSLSDSRRKKF
jgi:hypothetical protein